MALVVYMCDSESSKHMRGQARTITKAGRQSGWLYLSCGLLAWMGLREGGKSSAEMKIQDLTEAAEGRGHKSLCRIWEGGREGERGLMMMKKRMKGRRRRNEAAKDGLGGMSEDFEGGFTATRVAAAAAAAAVRQRVN